MKYFPLYVLACFVAALLLRATVFAPDDEATAELKHPMQIAKPPPPGVEPQYGGCIPSSTPLTVTCMVEP